MTKEEKELVASVQLAIIKGVAEMDAEKLLKLISASLYGANCFDKRITGEAGKKKKGR